MEVWRRGVWRRPEGESGMLMLRLEGDYDGGCGLRGVGGVTLALVLSLARDFACFLICFVLGEVHDSAWVLWTVLLSSWTVLVVCSVLSLGS